MSYQAQIWHVDSRLIVLQHIFRVFRNFEKNVDTQSNYFQKHFFNFGGQNIKNRKIGDGSLVARPILHLFGPNYFSLSSKL